LGLSLIPDTIHFWSFFPFDLRIKKRFFLFLFFFLKETEDVLEEELDEYSLYSSLELELELEEDDIADVKLKKV